MAEPPRDVAAAEHRLAAVGAVEQVMRAVWALARAQLPLAEAAAADASAHLDWVHAVIDRLAGPPAPVEHAHTLWVVIGPERALCGPLARMHLDAIPRAGDVGLVGTRLWEVAEQDLDLAPRVGFRLPAATTPDEIPQRAEALAREILARSHERAVVLLHAGAGAAVVTSRLLTGPRALADDPPETFLPPEEVLAAAVTEVVSGRLAVALADALRAEVRARLTAADAARRAAERDLDALRHQWRVLRQESITQELVELTTGRRRPAKALPPSRILGSGG